MYGCFLHAPQWGPGLQPRHVPWLGFESVTLWFTDQCSIHWATSARVESSSFINCAITIILPLKVTYFCHLRVWVCHLSVSACLWMCGFACVHLSPLALYYSCGVWNPERVSCVIEASGTISWQRSTPWQQLSWSSAAFLSTEPHSLEINHEPLLLALTSQFEPQKLEENFV